MSLREKHEKVYTLLFGAAVCVVFSLPVAFLSYALGPRQTENKLLDKQKKVLIVAGLMEEGESLSNQEVAQRFANSIVPKIVDLERGVIVEDVDPLKYDQHAALHDPAMSKPAPPNAAQVLRLPKYVKIYEVMKEGQVDQYVLPIEGKGLWSTLYGFLSVDTDLNTIRGITFYQHGETPGLGGEVDNPRWKSLWADRKIYGEDGEVRIHVMKGQAGPPADAPYAVDGLSGATLTSNGVTNTLAFWLGEHGLKPFLDNLRQERSGV